LAMMAESAVGFEEAALRVFSNADGAYGGHVNQLIESGAWTQEEELANMFTTRKSFAHSRSGQSTSQSAVMKSVLKRVDLAYQNLESVELGVTTVDHYFDSLGGISRAAKQAGGKDIPVYIGDQTRGKGQVRSLGEQVALESRTRALNPKWYEGMLKHGPEGVRHIECHLTNTMGWSATTGAVEPWVYQKFTETYVMDEAMRQRLAELNPKAAAKVVNRLLEAHRRDYWKPDAATLEALERAGEELEDKLEGIGMEVAA
jgi:magnesium chelatase subunit H